MCLAVKKTPLIEQREVHQGNHASEEWVREDTEERTKQTCACEDKMVVLDSRVFLREFDN